MTRCVVCRCESCGREFAFVAGHTISRTICYFCSLEETEQTEERVSLQEMEAAK